MKDSRALIVAALHVPGANVHTRRDLARTIVREFISAKIRELEQIQGVLDPVHPLDLLNELCLEVTP